MKNKINLKGDQREVKPTSYVDRSLRDARQPIVHIDLPLRDARHLRNALVIASNSVSQAGGAERVRYSLLSVFISTCIRDELKGRDESEGASE